VMGPGVAGRASNFWLRMFTTFSHSTTGASQVMSSKADPIRLLRRCFSREEWDWLMEEPDFTDALAGSQTLDDSEKLISFGLHLISLARQNAHPLGRTPPPARSALP
jgi:hypothetical protein